MNSGLLLKPTLEPTVPPTARNQRVEHLRPCLIFDALLTATSTFDQLLA
jgi:hypothetical protein